MNKILIVAPNTIASKKLAKSILDSAAKYKIDIDVTVLPESLAVREKENYDIILIYPKLRFLIDERNSFINKGKDIAFVVDSIHFGNADGSAVLEQIANSLKT